MPDIHDAIDLLDRIVARFGGTAIEHRLLGEARALVAQYRATAKAATSPMTGLFLSRAEIDRDDKVFDKLNELLVPAVRHLMTDQHYERIAAVREKLNHGGRATAAEIKFVGWLKGRVYARYAREAFDETAVCDDGDDPTVSEEIERLLVPATRPFMTPRQIEVVTAFRDHLREHGTLTSRQISYLGFIGRAADWKYARAAATEKARNAPAKPHRG